MDRARGETQTAPGRLGHRTLHPVPEHTGEQSTLFIRDPSGNALEFKSFGDIAAQLFAT